jgi:hypothetical protein
MKKEMYKEIKQLLAPKVGTISHKTISANIPT